MSLMVRSAAQRCVSNHEAGKSVYALRASAPSIMSTVFCRP